MHPDPEKRRRRKEQDKDPTIKFISALKYDTFKAKVKREFEAWRQEAEAARPRRQVGDRIRSPDEARMGDFAEFYTRQRGRAKYKVVGVTDKSILLRRVDSNGRFMSDRTTRFNKGRLRRVQVTRLDELKRKEIPFDQAKQFLDEQLGHPDRDVDTRKKYKAWMEKEFREGRRSPYLRLGDDEPEHQAQLKEHIKNLLEERGIGDDWSWTAPPHASMGQRVRDPFQLRKFDFIQYGASKYKVTDIEDDGRLRVQRVDSNGRPSGAPTTFDRDYLRTYNIKRIDEVKRPDISFDDAKRFADDKIGFPDRRVNSQQEYRAWLQEGFERSGSPFYQLGEDEEKHQKKLKKYLDKLLDERGVGAAWTWQPPPHADIGQLLKDPFQLHTGDFFSQNQNYGYKVLEIMDDGRVKAIKIRNDTGRPWGEPSIFERYRFERNNYKRVDEIKRPDVSFEEAKKFADDHIGYAPPRVNSNSEYREWLEQKFTGTTSAPFYQLGEDETDHKAKLDQYIGKLLEARGVGSDWAWEPPPQAEMDQRVTDPLQLRSGDFIKYSGVSGGWKVAEITPDGKAKMLRVDANGRPSGEEAYEWDARKFNQAEYRRTEPIKRPEVTSEKARAFADQYLMEPGRAVRTQEKYREWLSSEFLNNTRSPYYQLGDDEPEHQAKFKQQIDELLEARNIGADWTWRPPPLVELPSDQEWQQRHDVLRRMVLDGTQKGDDKRLGGGGINGGKRRRMKLGDEDHEYVFKDAGVERGDARRGTPKGTLHLREQAAYTLDRLLGDGVVVPPTVSDGTGSYQAFVPGAKTWAGGNRGSVTDTDLKRHPEVQRTILIDVLMGHEDRHGNNMMFSWADPTGPKNIDNMRFHAIDNGYAFAHPKDKQSAEDFVVRHPWDDSVVKSVVEQIPDELHEKLKEVKPQDLLKTLVSSGIKDEGALATAAFRLLALQDNPGIIGKLMAQGGRRRSTHAAQQKFHWLAAKEPEKLLEDYTDLPKSKVDEIKQQVQDAMG
jgi:hypothetical protein